MTQLYQHISVDSNLLEYKSFTVAGDLYDHFTISKSKKGINSFKEGPDVAKINQRTEIPEGAVKNYNEEELQKYKSKFQVK